MIDGLLLLPASFGRSTNLNHHWDTADDGSDHLVDMECHRAAQIAFLMLSVPKIVDDAPTL